MDHLDVVEEEAVLIPKYLVFRDDRLVWKEDMAKGSLIWPLEGDIQKIQVRSQSRVVNYELNLLNTNSRAAVNWLSLCRKSSDLEASDLVPAPIFSTRSNFLVRRDVQEGDDVVVFEQQLRTQEEMPSWPSPSVLLPWILTQRKLSLDAMRETSNAVMSTTSPALSHLASFPFVSLPTMTSPLQSTSSLQPMTSQLASMLSSTKTRDVMPTFQITSFPFSLFPFGFLNQNVPKNVTENVFETSNNNVKELSPTLTLTPTPTLVKRLKMTSSTGQEQHIEIKPRRRKTMLPCCVCGKSFDRPSLLKRHMRTHTGEKPHICDVCKKGFSTSSSLNTHRRIHSGEKPHQCLTCGKRFTASSNLYYHRMTHNKDKPHKCRQCDKSFATPGDLKSHQEPIL